MGSPDFLCRSYATGGAGPLGGFFLVSLVSLVSSSQAPDFACVAGDVACLIDVMNQANANDESNTIRYPIFTLNTGGRDGQGTVTSLDHNLLGDPTGCMIALQPNDLTGDPASSCLGTGVARLRGWVGTAPDSTEIPDVTVTLTGLGGCQDTTTTPATGHYVFRKRLDSQSASSSTMLG
jgi:hypothetical protein